MTAKARTLATIQAEWDETSNAINALDTAVGNKPWDLSIADPAWRNPHRPGTPQHAALDEVHTEAMRLDRRWQRLRVELDRSERAQ